MFLPAPVWEIVVFDGIGFEYTDYYQFIREGLMKMFDVLEAAFACRAPAGGKFNQNKLIFKFGGVVIVPGFDLEKSVDTFNCG